MQMVFFAKASILHGGSGCFLGSHLMSDSYASYLLLVTVCHFPIFAKKTYLFLSFISSASLQTFPVFSASLTLLKLFLFSFFLQNLRFAFLLSTFPDNSWSLPFSGRSSNKMESEAREGALRRKCELAAGTRRHPTF